MKKYLVDVVNHPTTSVYMPNMRTIFIKYEQIVKTIIKNKFFCGTLMMVDCGVKIVLWDTA